ncbi:MAG: radical SAM protein [bacterium]|nr:radical SAM protein [bacterium]
MKVPYFLQRLDNRLSLLTVRLVKDKPLFLVRALGRAMWGKISKNHKYRGVMFSTHYKCNLQCSHCYEKKFTQTERPPLTTEEKKEILRQCIKEGVLAFDFIGGESHLDPDFEELVAACQPRKHYITLVTNGYGFSKGKIKRYLDIGIDKFNISIDSWYPEAHDAFRRKKGSHSQALKTLQLCRETGMDVSITVVVYNGNTAEPGFVKLVEFAVENRIRLNFKFAVPLGQWEGDMSNLATREDKERVKELHATYPFLTRDIYGNEKHTCPALKDFFTITGYGDVLPCNSIHISFGNLRERPLNSILAEVKEKRYAFQNYQGCPAAEDPQFIREVLGLTFNANPYPVTAEEVFDKTGKAETRRMENKEDKSTEGAA